MATLENLRDDVRLLLNETTAGRWSDTLVDMCINKANREFSKDTGILLAPHHTDDLVAKQADYDYPTDCPGPQAIIAIFAGGTKLEATGQNALIRLGKKPHSDAATADADIAKWYTINDEVIAGTGGLKYSLYPIPYTSVTDGLIVWYWRLAYELTEDAHVSPIPDTYENGPIFKATQLALEVKDLVVKAKIYEAKYTKEVVSARAYIDAVMKASLQDRDADEDTEMSIF